MKKAVIYIHGKGGDAKDSARYTRMFPDCDVFGMDYRARTPREAETEFPILFETLVGTNVAADIIADSIGAYFAMRGLHGARIGHAFFISPIVNMEKLICDMMAWENVTENELRSKREIPTAFGEVLSWDYLCDVRKHPPEWSVQTDVLYGSSDNLTSYETVSAWAEKQGAHLTVMDGGEHWFHTDEQLRFLEDWIKRAKHG